jgi:DNA-binding response OmpR family regulator
MDTILVVDDDPRFLTRAQEELEQAGFAVLVAENPAQCQTHLETAAVQAIVLEPFLRDIDGMALLQRLRGEWPDVPTVIVSGRASSLTGAQAMGLGAVEFLPKPPPFAELGRLLAAAIQGSRGTPPGPQHLAQLARRHQAALEASSLIRWETLEEALGGQAFLTHQVMDLIAGALRAEIVFLLLAAEGQGTLRIAYARGLDPAIQRQAIWSMDEGILGRAAGTGEPVLIRDLSQDSPVGEMEFLSSHHVTSLMCAPVKVDGEPFGLMTACNRLTGEPFEARDLDLLAGFASLLSRSLEAIRLSNRLAFSVDELALAGARLARANLELARRQAELPAPGGQVVGN